MKILTKYLMLSLFFASMLIFIGCGEEHIIDNSQQNGNGVLAGKIISSSGGGLSGVTLNINGTNYYTDNRGEFYISNLPEASNQLVTISANGYVFTQKAVSVKRFKTSYLSATLFTIGKTSNISGSSGGTITFQNASVVFPANAIIDSKGSPFAGNVTVKSTYFDPTHKEFVSAFPGEFRGLRTNGSETPIESFGFINVELSNGSEKLNLATGKSATITMPIPASIASKAPATIPLWWYDESKGIWKEEGFATKNGNNYTGTVIHFSSWNCDQPTQTSFLKGKVVDGNGNPLYFAQVTSKGFDYTGQSSVYTDESGNFVIPVKSNSQAKITARYHFFLSDTSVKTTPATPETTDVGNIVILVDTTKICIVRGKLVDNGGNPLSNYYVELRDDKKTIKDYRTTSKDGKFTMFGELGQTYTVFIKLYSRSDSTQKTDSVTRTVSFTKSNETIDLGDIKLDIGGSTIIGRILDKDNNPVAKTYVFSNEPGMENGTNQGSMQTDSLGRFSLWVRPEKEIKINVYSKPLTKSFTVTSGLLGETKDVGDLKLD